MADSKWVKGANGLWHSEDRVIKRRAESKAARETAEMERYRKRMDALLNLCETREDCLRMAQFCRDELQNVVALFDAALERIE